MFRRKNLLNPIFVYYYYCPHTVYCNYNVRPSVPLSNASGAVDAVATASALWVTWREEEPGNESKNKHISSNGLAKLTLGEIIQTSVFLAVDLGGGFFHICYRSCDDVTKQHREDILP